VNRVRIGGLLLAVAAAFALALLARFQLVEPRGAELICSGLNPPGWCPLRTALVPVFTFQGFGLASLAAGLLAMRGGSAAWGVAALLFGAAGMVLYNVEAASVGTILGLIAVTREPRAAS